MNNIKKKETLLAHAGLVADEPTGAISMPIYQSATFRHPALGQSTGFDYSRSQNPTRKVLEDAIAGLENGKKAFAFSTGMAAITAVLTLFKSGDHFVVSDDLYGGTYRLFEEIFSRFGFTASYVDSSDCSALSAAVTEHTRAVLIETPSNPMMKISDIKAIADITKKNKLLLIVDNTFMTPYLQRPLELGADIVVHSGTKYLGGHNDLLAGFVVAASDDICARLGFIQNATGAVLSPYDSWLALRGLKTLAVRMDRSEENAQKIVAWLQKQKNIAAIYYPGIMDSPGCAVQKLQASGFGSMISFRVDSKIRAVNAINRIKIISFAESLGGVESLMTYPCMQTHAAIPEEMRVRLGVTDDLLRLSIGIENAEDLISDLDNALNGENYEI